MDQEWERSEKREGNEDLIESRSLYLSKFALT